MAEQKELFNVGKIVNTHGIKGEVKVASITDFPEQRYKKNNILYLEDESHPLTIESVRVHKGMYMLKFAEIKDMTQAELLKNKVLKTTHESNELSDNEFYYHDIIGLVVNDKSLGELGKITEIMSPGANDVWVVNSKQYGEVLIPYIPSVVLKVDLKKAVVEVEIPEGLID